MRVLLLSPEFAPPGGIQYVARLIASALRAKYDADLRIDAVSLADGAELPAGLTADSWHGCRGGRARFLGVAGRLLARRRYDAVILNHLHLLPAALMARTFRSGRVFLVVHGVEAWAPIPRRRLAGLSGVEKILFVSEFSRGRSLEANPALASVPGTVCHLGLIDDERPPNGLPSQDPPAALMIGRMASDERYKGFDETIAVWPDVRRKVPGAELWIVGDGDDRPRLERAATTGSGVRFFGRVDDATMQDLFARCRCLCLPSRGEGFGLVYIEAMRAARPVLCGPGAGAEVVGDGEAGRAVDPSDGHALTEVAVELLGADGRRREQAARARFERHFSFEAFVRRFAEAIEAVPRRETRV